METNKIESVIIDYIKNNIEDSGDEVPDITRTTKVLTDITGFDSLRALEVLIDLEELFKFELPSADVFIKMPPGTDDISDLAKAIQIIIEQGDA